MTTTRRAGPNAARQRAMLAASLRTATTTVTGTERAGKGDRLGSDVMESMRSDAGSTR